MTRSRQLQQARRRRKLANARRRDAKMEKRNFNSPPDEFDIPLCPLGNRREEPCDCLMHRLGFSDEALMLALEQSALNAVLA